MPDEEPADSFKPGDVVRLKSGGPRMVIARRDPSTTGWVLHWFDRAVFKDATLECELELVPPDVLELLPADERRAIEGFLEGFRRGEKPV